jgi:hypothetical protein
MRLLSCQSATTAGIILAGYLFGFFSPAPASADPKPPPPPIVISPNPRGIVGIGATSPGHSGSQGSSVVSVSGPSCVEQILGEAILRRPSADTTVWFQDVLRTCSDGTSSEFYRTVTNGPAGAPVLAPATAATLAQVAYGQLVLPHPTAGRSPSGRLQDGRPYTFVKAFMWFWTDPATYGVRVKRVQAGPVWAQVTAQPVSLSLDPGDGQAAVACAGPGRAWQDGRDGQWDRAPGGCDYQYQRSTFGYPRGELTATFGIAWRVSWTGSTGAAPAGGVLPDLRTTTTDTFAVAEAQAVVTR